MRKSRFSEEQIVAFSTAVSTVFGSFYKWKARYGGLQISIHVKVFVYIDAVGP